VTTNIGNLDVSGLRSSQLGNIELRPERATEWEGGVEAHVLDSRVGLEFTYYRKTSKDALVNRTIAPSAGSSSGSELTNLGSVENSGIEGQLTANVLRSSVIRSARWKAIR
jgi:outer membrane receptor protein involved in Fe transport